MSFEFNIDNPIVVISSFKYKDLLIPSICELSTKVQKKYIRNSNGMGNSVILNIENEALDHIEQVILDIFNSILTIGEVESSFSSIYSNESSLNRQKTTNLLTNPIKTVADAEMRVRMVLPRNYTDEVCIKAHRNIDKYNSIRSESSAPSKGLKLLRTLASNTILSNSLTNQFISSTSHDLAQIFTFPFDRIYEILCKDIFNVSSKLDINIAIFLVSVLEFIATDILHFTSSFVRFLNKYTITKQDLSLAISAEPILTDLFNSSRVNGYNKMNQIDHDIDQISCENSSLISYDSSVSSKKLNKSNLMSASSIAINQEDTKSSSMMSYSISNLASEINDECISECSTICPDSFSIDKIKEKYITRVKELIFEQNQHLNDLNVLRRIFMYSLDKYCQEKDKNINIDLEETIFGNINEVYECALRLTDLLDDVMSSCQQKEIDNVDSVETSQQQDMVLVGAQFWELAEGNEFDVYLKYSTIVTNKSQINLVLKSILSNQDIYNYLQQISNGLGDITRYLLPQLLLGSVYHVLYLYETVDYLLQISFEKDDREFLKDTLDTLKQIKFDLDEMGYTRSKYRPIETSFRMFQHHQLNLIRRSLTNEATNNINYNLTFNKNNKALSYNISSLTQSKWRELEQTLDNDLSKSKTKNNIRYAFLYEGPIMICKTHQSINQTDLKSLILNQSKNKLSNRYAYLFEDQIILVKRSNDLSNSKSKLKQIITLNNCHLNDRLDECCFELQLATTVSHGGSHSLFSFHHQHNGNSIGSSGSNLQNQDYYIFITETPKQKHEWMAMLCYSLYKFSIDRLLQLMNDEHNKNNPLPIPPKGYIFDHPDTPETILFDLPLQQNTDFPSLSQPGSVNGFSIRAATLIKLIEYLTHPLYLHPKLSDTFLMVYREFTNSAELLALLIQRYDVPNMSVNDLDTDEPIIVREISNRYRREYQKPIRLKVINFIKHWINRYYEEDFEDDDTELSQTLYDFMERVGKSNKNLQQVLIKALQRKKNYLNGDFMRFKSKSTSSYDSASSEEMDNLKNLFMSNLNLNNDENNNNQEKNQNLVIDDMPPYETHLENVYPYDILTIHPLELARQATLMEFELYSAIKSKELIKCGWTKPKEKYKLSPNVINSINLFNKFVYWYCKCIVDTLNFEERVAVVQRILDIAGYFYELKNFNGMRQIFAALESLSVHRLKLTKEKAGLEQHEMYKIFKNLFDTHNKGYLDKLRNCSPPCMPFTASHLAIIAGKYEHNKLYSNDLNKEDAMNGNQTNNLINFSQYRLTFQFINEFLQYQTNTYKFKVNHKIRAFLLQDMEKYFEKAFSELRNKNEELEQSVATELVKEYIYEKSKQIESENEYQKYPRTRNYPLKSPPLINQSNIHKIVNISSKIIGNKNNGGSTTKLDNNNNNNNNKDEQSCQISDTCSLNEEKNSKSLLTTVNDIGKRTSPNHLLSASSSSLVTTPDSLFGKNSSNLIAPTNRPPPPPSDPPPRPPKDGYQNKFKSANKDNIQIIINRSKFYIDEEENSQLDVPFNSKLKNEKNSQLSSSSSFINQQPKSGANFSNTASRLSSSSMIFPLAASSSNNMNMINSSPKLTSTFLSPFLSSSENSIQLDKLDIKMMRKIEDSSPGFYPQEKLSSSSSSVPNSPPPEYSDVCNDSDVFDSERSPNNCYDNKTYFQKISNPTYSTLSDVNNNTSKLSSTPKKNQNFFHFPDSTSSFFSEKNKPKNQINRTSTYELTNQNQQTMNHFHTIGLPPPPFVPPPPPPLLPPTQQSLINSNTQFQIETESIRSNNLEKSKNNPPLPPRPK